MAYFQQDDKQNQDPNSQQGMYGAQATGGSFAGGTSSAGGQGGAQVGTGGTQPFTNIQEYLKSNPQGSGGGTALAGQANKQIESEQQDLQKQQSQYEGGLANNYNAYNQQEQQYGQGVGNLRHAFSKNAPDLATQQANLSGQIGQQFNPGSAFSYSQNQGPGSAYSYNNAIQQGGGPGGYASLYAQAVPGGLNTGQQALQNQLDLGDPNFQSSLNGISSNYGNYQNKIGAANTAEAGKQSDYTNQAKQSQANAQGQYNKYLQDVAGYNQHMSQYDASGNSISPGGMSEQQQLDYGAKNPNVGALGVNFNRQAIDQAKKLRSQYGFDPYNS